MAKRSSAADDVECASGKRQRQLFRPMTCPFCRAELTRGDYGKHVSCCGTAVYVR